MGCYLPDYVIYLVVEGAGKLQPTYGDHGLPGRSPIQVLIRIDPV